MTPPYSAGDIVWVTEFDGAFKERFPDIGTLRVPRCCVVDDCAWDDKEPYDGRWVTYLIIDEAPDWGLMAYEEHLRPASVVERIAELA